jgi:hypothetical protein
LACHERIGLKGQTLRLVIGFLGPIVLVAVAYGFINAFHGAGNIRNNGLVGLLTFYAAFIFAGIPTLICSLVVEFFINKNIKNIIGVGLGDGLKYHYDRAS